MSEWDFMGPRERDAHLRNKIKDLKDSLVNNWVSWGPWEKDFINDMQQNLNCLATMGLTPKQESKVLELWDKI